MSQIIINNDNTFDITRYARYTEIMNGRLYAIATVMLSSINYLDEIEALSLIPVTDIQVKINNEIVYHLSDLEARISHIEEVMNDESIALSFNIDFNHDRDNDESENEVD